jgi:hypothetical protein
MESAFIVYMARGYTLKEKQEVYREIIRTMPDMEIAKRSNCPYYSSLHEFLQQYMEVENKLLEIFRRDSDKAVYRYEIYCEEQKFRPMEEHTIFSTIASATAEMNESRKWFEHSEPTTYYEGALQGFGVAKRWLDTDESIGVMLSTENEVLRVYNNDSGELTKKESVIFDSLDGFWAEIPTPFKKGDFLISSDPWTMRPLPLGISNSEPFVLNRICYWDLCDKDLKYHRESADSSDMTAYGYWVDSNGDIYYECTHNYHDLRYFHGELDDNRRILKAISSHAKGELGYEVLLNAHFKLKAERHFKEAVRENIYMGTRYPSDYVSLEWLMKKDE